MSANRHYWLHRIKNAESVSRSLLFDHGLLSYGWATLASKKPGLVLARSDLCREELMANWEILMRNEEPFRIEPL